MPLWAGMRLASGFLAAIIAKVARLRSFYPSRTHGDFRLHGARVLVAHARVDAGE